MCKLYSFLMFVYFWLSTCPAFWLLDVRVYSKTRTSVMLTFRLAYEKTSCLHRSVALVVIRSEDKELMCCIIIKVRTNVPVVYWNRKVSG